jgi:peptide deformylase
LGQELLHPPMQGILFHDRMKPSVVDSVRGSLVALEETFIKANPGVPVQRVPLPKAKGFGGGLATAKK